MASNLEPRRSSGSFLDIDLYLDVDAYLAEGPEEAVHSINEVERIRAAGVCERLDLEG